MIYFISGLWPFGNDTFRNWSFPTPGRSRWAGVPPINPDTSFSLYHLETSCVLGGRVDKLGDRGEKISPERRSVG